LETGEVESLKNGIELKDSAYRPTSAEPDSTRPTSAEPNSTRPTDFSVLKPGIFFIFVFKKIKISKIYGGFEKFQNYTPVAPCLGDRGPVALWLGDRT